MLHFIHQIHLFSLHTNNLNQNYKYNCFTKEYYCQKCSGLKGTSLNVIEDCHQRQYQIDCSEISWSFDSTGTYKI